MAEGFNGDNQAGFSIGPFRSMFHEIQAAIQIFTVDSSVSGIEKKQLSVHGGGVAVCNMRGRAQPFKITHIFAVDRRMNESSLRTELKLSVPAGDGLGQDIWRYSAQRQINIGEMLAIQFIKFAIIGGVVLRPVPPVPITAFSDEEFLMCQRLL